MAQIAVGTVGGGSSAARCGSSLADVRLVSHDGTAWKWLPNPAPHRFERPLRDHENEVRLALLADGKMLISGDNDAESCGSEMCALRRVELQWFGQTRAAN